MEINLPTNYAWLANEPAPKMLIEALKLFGTLETPGNASNPVIMQWAKELGLQDTYSNDAIPWCGLFMAIVAKRAGKDVPVNPLWALNWARFGKQAYTAKLGDVLVFRRGNNSGHVALYVGEDETCYHTLGGNQSDSVCIIRMAKNRLYAVRNQYHTAQPANCRVVNLAPGGTQLSINEK